MSKPCRSTSSTQIQTIHILSIPNHQFLFAGQVSLATSRIVWCWDLVRNCATMGTWSEGCCLGTGIEKTIWAIRVPPPNNCGLDEELIDIYQAPATTIYLVLSTDNPGVLSPQLIHRGVASLVASYHWTSQYRVYWHGLEMSPLGVLPSSSNL